MNGPPPRFFHRRSEGHGESWSTGAVLYQIALSIPRAKTMTSGLDDRPRTAAARICGQTVLRHTLRGAIVELVLFSGRDGLGEEVGVATAEDEPEDDLPSVTLVSQLEPKTRAADQAHTEC